MKELKVTKEIALTYLLPISVEDYLSSTGVDVGNYDVRPVYGSSSGIPECYNYKTIEYIENLLDELQGPVGAKLFTGGIPDIDFIFSEKHLIGESKELGADVVVVVKTQYPDSAPSLFSLGQHTVYLEGLALVSKD
ncbi:MAG: hypothetical protein K0B07_00905 [DPANN group archaeon]|nr:hypothetical protein [DPANN group archaeon]